MFNVIEGQKVQRMRRWQKEIFANQNEVAARLLVSEIYNGHQQRLAHVFLKKKNALQLQGIGLGRFHVFREAFFCQRRLHALLV